MISAREFCQEPGYPITIFLTYSFDPLFFERVPLDALKVGGSRRIVIVADACEAAEAMRRCIGQIFYLGRSYVLAETRVANTFHPKMIVRLSPTGGRVWIGSGNLTFTGWGGNQELATAWSIGPGLEDDGTWLSGVFEAVGSLTKSATFFEQMKAVRSSIGWLGSAPAVPGANPVLLSIPNRPLAPQMAERWKGRVFNELKIYTGSTDVDGAFLLWAHKTFGIAKVVICLSPAFASFDAKKLSKMPFEVRFVETDRKRLMHAKFYWFSGPGGNAAVMGSANCSAAAWLASHDAGNVELVVAYDQADAAQFNALLAAFDGKRLLPTEVLNAPPVQTKQASDENEEGARYQIVSLRLRSSGHLIEATVEPLPPADVAVHLIVPTDVDELRVVMEVREGKCVGRLPPNRSIGVATAFGTIEIVSGGHRSVTAPRWIDNEPAIERAVREREANPGMETLARRDFGNLSQQSIMAAVYSVTADLLNLDKADAEEPGRAGGEASSDDDDEPGDAPIHMLDPANLLFSLRDLVSESGAKHRDHMGLHGISLQGVIGMLFATKEENEIDLSQETWDGETLADDADDDNPKTNPKRGLDKAPPDPATSAEILAELRGHIDHILFELGRPTFAAGCTAGALMKASAFPILLCAKIEEAGYLPERMLASVAIRVVDIMLRKSYGPGQPRGLLRQVKARYEASGRQDEFLRVVGEGAVWAALLASLAREEASSLSDLIRQAAAVSAVLACPDLVATSTADQLSIYVRALIIRDAEFAVTKRAGRLADAMSKLTGVLGANWETLYRNQGSGKRLHTGGSIMWSPQWGWEVLPLSSAQSYSAGNINLSLAADENGDVQQALNTLWEGIRSEFGRACSPKRSRLLLGLGEDRICVQVKSGDGAANHDVVLRLIGLVSNTQARTGLLVSIGGVNTVAQKELDANFFKLRLWQMPDLLKALFRAYGDLSDETRTKLPLKQIWAPISESDN